MTCADAQPADNTIDGHLRAAKRAAAFEFRGLLGALCVAPQNRPPPDVAPPPPPDRTRFYVEPGKMFDDAWSSAPKTARLGCCRQNDGLILIDTTFEYETDPVIVGGLKKLGFDPAAVKYVIITHAHPGEVGGAKMMQDRFGSHIVMGAGDWDMIEKSVNLFPKGKPKRDIAVTERQDLTLGGRTVTIVPMPGHTPGTLSLIFGVKDNGKPLTVAFPGGTEFNFVNDVPHFDLYPRLRAQVRRRRGRRRRHRADDQIRLELDNAATKLRLLKDRHPWRSAPARCGRRHGGALLQSVRGMRHGGADEAVSLATPVIVRLDRAIQ